MPARAHEAQIDERDRRLPAGGDEAMRASFEFRDSCSEFKGGRSSIEAVAIRGLRLIPVISDIRRRAEDGRGPAEGRSSERAKSLRRGSRGVYQLGTPVECHRGSPLRGSRIRGYSLNSILAFGD